MLRGYTGLRLVLLLALLVCIGCGKTVQRNATEQLIMSDAVDKSIRSIDFSPLAGKVCYLDTTYLKNIKSITFVNAEYIIGTLRNQLIAAGCQIVDDQKDAELIVEARAGALGTDLHEVVYGIPQNNLISAAATLMPTVPPVPAIPEIALMRRDTQNAAAKVAVFAFDAKSGYAVWQSGTEMARSVARDYWVFGAGPFQSGTIYDRPRFAGVRLRLPLLGDNDDDQRRQAISHDEEFVFASPPPAPVPVPGAIGPEERTADGRDAKDEKPSGKAE